MNEGIKPKRRSKNPRTRVRGSRNVRGGRHADGSGRTKRESIHTGSFSRPRPGEGIIYKYATREERGTERRKEMDSCRMVTFRQSRLRLNRKP